MPGGPARARRRGLASACVCTSGAAARPSPAAPASRPRPSPPGTGRAPTHPIAGVWRCPAARSRCGCSPPRTASTSPSPGRRSWSSLWQVRPARLIASRIAWRRPTTCQSFSAQSTRYRWSVASRVTVHAAGRTDRLSSAAANRHPGCAATPRARRRLPASTRSSHRSSSSCSSCLPTRMGGIRPDRTAKRSPSGTLVGPVTALHVVEAERSARSACSSSSDRSFTSTAQTVAAGERRASVSAIGPHPQPRSSRSPASGGAGTCLASSTRGAGVDAARR